MQIYKCEEKQSRCYTYHTMQKNYKKKNMKTIKNFVTYNLYDSVPKTKIVATF